MDTIVPDDIGVLKTSSPDAYLTQPKNLALQQQTPKEGRDGVVHSRDAMLSQSYMVIPESDRLKYFVTSQFGLRSKHVAE